MKRILAGRCFLVLLLGVLVVLARPCIGAQKAEAAPKEKAAATGDAANGKRIYLSYGCYECHGREGQGSSLTGPRIGPEPIPFSAFVEYVRQPKGQMPPYTIKVISDTELAAIHVFLKSLPRPPATQSIPLLNDGGKTDK